MQRATGGLPRVTGITSHRARVVEAKRVVVVTVVPEMR
jgi:hypothetical protein